MNKYKSNKIKVELKYVRTNKKSNKCTFEQNHNRTYYFIEQKNHRTNSRKPFKITEQKKYFKITEQKKVF